MAMDAWSVSSDFGASLSDDRGEPIVVGLVNNMPDAALRSTERQFFTLLAAATGKRAVKMRIFSLAGLSRSESGRQHVREHHEDIEMLWETNLDGLIVTGTEPRCSELAHEPYWRELTKLVDWAARHTASTIWSCLAAHAAVKCLDGIERRALAAKLSGVFECSKIDDHPLVATRAARWCTPHSRSNELREEDLVSRGYTVLARSSAAGSDTFAKHIDGSLFLFLQGHPEYEGDTLLREYRRDIGRFLAGEADSYPALPTGYLDDKAAGALLRFRELALCKPDSSLLSRFPVLLVQQNLLQPWRNSAVCLYANWLSYLTERKSTHRRLTARAGGCRGMPNATNNWDQWSEYGNLKGVQQNVI
jgi:homoserine O-succinyltransferase/O-acetyltransferase